MTNEVAHTPEPWAIDDNQTDIISVADGYEIVDTAGVHLHASHTGNDGHWNYDDGSARDIPEEEEIANAHRIVACVNACAGLSTEALEQGALMVALAALTMARAETHSDCTEEGCSDYCTTLTAPIEALKGGAA